MTMQDLRQQTDRFERRTPLMAVPPQAADPRVDVEIVIPVYNEERALVPCIQQLTDYLDKRFPYSATITIADNASTDGTWPLAQLLAETLPNVNAVHLDQKGRGRALHATWSISEAKVVCYMDVDLSTDLAALPPLVASLLSGHSQIAIGSRLARGAQVRRGAKREVISRCYNALLRTILHVRFSDAQCGFKAARADCVQNLLPLVEDTQWFFDTELLVVAERSGMRIHEVAVDWDEDTDSRVDIIRTALQDLRGVGRLAWRIVTRSLATGAAP